MNTPPPLADILPPPAPSFWPLAPGWWLLIALLLLLAAGAYGFSRRHRALAYRRQARQRLAQLRQQLDRGYPAAQIASDWGVLLKWVGQQQLGPRCHALHGQPWHDALQQLAPLPFPASTLSLSYQAAPPIQPLREALAQTDQWLRRLPPKPRGLPC